MKTRSSTTASSSHSVVAQLQIVDPTSSRGKLLPGWTVANRSSRSSKGSVDTYFIEPGTGREFPSLESVQRHLLGEVNEKRLARAGRHVSNEEARAYERSRTNQDHLSIVHASKSFRLPKGWAVQEFPRLNSYHVDKYYVERKTGKRFRSLVSVERYLKGFKNTTVQQPSLSPYHHVPSKDLGLPDGWLVEAKPRRNSGQIDKFYIEPGTGKKFRSLPAVERYLNGTVDSVNSGELSHGTVVIDPNNPPEKVKWVLTGPGGDMFSAHVDGSDVSSSVKEAWSEAFVSLIQDRS